MSTARMDAQHDATNVIVPPAPVTPRSWADLVEIEPRLAQLEDAILRASLPPRRSRDFWIAWEAVKARVERLVGWEAQRDVIATSEAYELAARQLFAVLDRAARRQTKRAGRRTL